MRRYADVEAGRPLEIVFTGPTARLTETLFMSFCLENREAIDHFSGSAGRRVSVLKDGTIIRALAPGNLPIDGYRFDQVIYADVYGYAVPSNVADLCRRVLHWSRVPENYQIQFFTED